MYNPLKDLYENASMMTPGTEITYRRYTLRKIGAEEQLPPDETEYMVLNTKGNQVENLTIGEFESYNAFQNKLDEIINYDPDNLQDWLSRDSK